MKHHPRFENPEGDMATYALALYRRMAGPDAVPVSVKPVGATPAECESNLLAAIRDRIKSRTTGQQAVLAAN